MKFTAAFLRVFEFLARMVGVLWVLGGLVFLLSALVSKEDRLVYLFSAVFLLTAGIGLVVAKFDKQKYLTR